MKTETDFFSNPLRKADKCTFQVLFLHIRNEKKIKYNFYLLTSFLFEWFAFRKLYWKCCRLFGFANVICMIEFGTAFKSLEKARMRLENLRYIHNITLHFIGMCIRKWNARIHHDLQCTRSVFFCFREWKTHFQTDWMKLLHT